MSLDKRDRCRSPDCRAEIIWAISAATGKLMPVDADPDNERGNVELAPTTDPANPTPVAHVHPQRPLTHVHPLHLSHFVTCPAASAWRKGRTNTR